MNGIIFLKTCSLSERGDIMKKKLIIILIAVFLTSSSTFYYLWFNTEYTITFVTNEGTEISSLNYQADDLIVLPDDPTKANYEFSGWYLDEALNTYFAEGLMPRENITLYADWGSENLLYTLIVDEYTVSKGTSTGGHVVIPKRHNDLLVTRIGLNGFSQNMSIISITIPDTIKSIGDYAFMMTSLTSVYIPNSVETIGIYAFAMSQHLTEITFEENSRLTEISTFAFYGASLVTSIEIPRSVTHIRSTAFALATALTSLTFEEGSQLIEIETNTFAMAANLEDLVLPEGLLTIGEMAFTNLYKLTNLVIPNTVTSIGLGAFSGTTALSAVYIPGSVITMGGAVFSGSRPVMLVIYCGAESQPSTWDVSWNNSSIYVEWGTTSTPSE